MMKYYIRVIAEEDMTNSIFDHVIASSLKGAIKWCKDKKYMTQRGKMEFLDFSDFKYAVHMTKWFHCNSRYTVNIYEIKEV